MGLGEIRGIEVPGSFCAIDASTNSLAFAHFVNDNLKSYGKIKFNGTTIYQKLSDTSKKTLALFNELEIDTIVIEQTIYANSPKTAANLALSQGALLGAASLSGVKYMGSVSPIVWQNYIGNKRLSADEKNEISRQFPGKSNSWLKTKEREFRKSRTIKSMNERFGTHISDDDVADAIAIGVYALDNWAKVMK